MRKRKWLSLLLSVAIVVTMLPIVAAAEDKGNISLSAITGNPSGSSNEGYANLFDGNTGSKWCCSFSGSAYVIFKASEPVKVSHYSIATANDTAGYSGRNPVEWTLSACMNYEDESTSWEVIHTVTDGGLPAANETYTDFVLSEPTPLYQYFKLEITKINSGSLMQISEIAMTQCDHKFEDTGTTIAPTCTEGGYDVYECSICHLQKNILNDEPANGHSYKNGIGICTVCGYWLVGYPVNYLDENGTEQTVVCDASITAEYLSNNSNTLTSGWYLVNSDVTIFDRIIVSGEVHLILANGYNLTVNGGIGVNVGNSLTIYAQSTDESNMGKLTATGNDGGAGIGSKYGEGAGGTIIINGGAVTATGNNGGAGIGGGIYTAGGTIIINGGTVTATGGSDGAGIGGGAHRAGGNITINGGTVTATGGSAGAGIGGGQYRAGGTIIINGGAVTATGNNGGAGIGGGMGDDDGGDNSGGTITINGGTVTATGNDGGAGIGGGMGVIGCANGAGGTITIKGGTVTATATGNYGGAGIGVGRFGPGGNITITGGTVTATGNSYAAGIGGSWYGEGGTITISGGTVTATGGSYAAGIGGGRISAGGTITISGGTVTATGNDGGAGIGDGCSGSGGTFSTDTTGNAVIFAGSISDQSGKADDATNPWNGVIFEGDDGTVYGSAVTPAVDFTIASGKSLLIPTGSELTISGITAVNNGSVYVDGSVSGLDGDLYYPLTVTGGTADKTYDYNTSTYGKMGETITLTGTDVPVGQKSTWTANPTVTFSGDSFTMPAFALTVSADGFVNAPTYTVTIPVTVELGGTATISASGVNVVAGNSLVVNLTDAQDFKLTTDEGAELSYGITKDSTALSVGGTVLTVAGGTANNTGSAVLTFSAPTTAVQYSGEYKGTVTFTVSVETDNNP